MKLTVIKRWVVVWDSIKVRKGDFEDGDRAIAEVLPRELGVVFAPNPNEARTIAAKTWMMKPDEKFHVQNSSRAVMNNAVGGGFVHYDSAPACRYTLEFTEDDLKIQPRLQRLYKWMKQQAEEQDGAIEQGG